MLSSIQFPLWTKANWLSWSWVSLNCELRCGWLTKKKLQVECFTFQHVETTCKCQADYLQQYQSDHFVNKEQFTDRGKSLLLLLRSAAFLFSRDIEMNRQSYTYGCICPNKLIPGRKCSHGFSKLLEVEGCTNSLRPEPQAVIFLHGIWRHIKEFGIEGQIPRISSPVKLEKRC